VFRGAVEAVRRGEGRAADFSDVHAICTLIGDRPVPGAAAKTSRWPALHASEAKGRRFDPASLSPLEEPVRRYFDHALRPAPRSGRASA
jgi:hypothetical protein